MADPVSYPLPRHTFTTYGEDWSKPENLVCSGPFLIESWRQGEEIRLQRNPYYWRTSADLLDIISLRFVSPTYQHYTNGVIDWCRFEDQLPPSVDGAETVILQQLGTFVLVFNCAYPPFDQVTVRRAFAHSIDQEGLIRDAWGGAQRAAMGGVVPPGMAGHSPEIGLLFVPEEARTALQQAAGNIEETLRGLKFAVMPLAEPSASFLANSWRSHLNVHVELVRDVDIVDILERFPDGDFHLALISLNADYPEKYESQHD